MNPLLRVNTTLLQRCIVVEVAARSAAYSFKACFIYCLCSVRALSALAAQSSLDGDRLSPSTRRILGGSIRSSTCIRLKCSHLLPGTRRYSTAPQDPRASAAWPCNRPRCSLPVAVPKVPWLSRKLRPRGWHRRLPPHPDKCNKGVTNQNTRRSGRCYVRAFTK